MGRKESRTQRRGDAKERISTVARHPEAFFPSEHLRNEHIKPGSPTLPVSDGDAQTKEIGDEAQGQDFSQLKMLGYVENGCGVNGMEMLQSSTGWHSWQKNLERCRSYGNDRQP